MKGISARIGDVFSIPLDDRHVAYGQVVARYGPVGYYYAIFRPTFPVHAVPPLESIATASVEFIALSFDGLIRSGDWVIRGNAPIPESLELPAYKVMRAPPDAFDIVDYSGEHRRPATADESRWVPYRVTMSPAMLVGALRAKHDLGPWKNGYEDLEHPGRATTKRLFSNERSGKSTV